MKKSKRNRRYKVEFELIDKKYLGEVLDKEDLDYYLKVLHYHAENIYHGIEIKKLKATVIQTPKNMELGSTKKGEKK